MTEKTTGSGPDSSPGKPQRLNFQPVSDDGEIAVFEAQSENRDTPGAPVFAVTITIASSVQRNSPKGLQELLSGMIAAFTVIPELPPDQDDTGEDVPFDITKQILIEVSLVSFDGTEPISVGVTVQTATGIVPVPSEIEEFFPNQVAAGLEDCWQAKPKQSLKATVKLSKGKGTVKNPPKPAAAGGTYYPTGKQIIVEANRGQSVDYSVSTNFVPAHRGVPIP